MIEHQKNDDDDEWRAESGYERRDPLLCLLLLLARCLSKFVERVFSRAGDHLSSAVITGWRYPHPVGCWWLGPGVRLQGAGGELKAWQEEPRVMEESGRSFNFCAKCFELNIWSLYVGGGFAEYDRFPQLMAG